MKVLKKLSLSEINQIDEVEFSIREDILSNYLIENITTIDSQDVLDNSICCLHNNKYINYLRDTKSKFCLTKKEWISEEFLDSGIIFLYSKNPYLSFAKILQKLFEENEKITRISPNAVISDKATIGKNCNIGANVIIADDVKIGDNVSIENNCYIGQGVEIGDNCIIYDNITIKSTIMGKDCIIHSGARIGQDGFGFAFDNKVFRHVKVPQIGRVIIGNDVEIGSNSCVDRGSFDDTVIGDNCKIDNLVQIAHNVKLGKSVLVISLVGIAGSTKIGDYSVIAGQAGIAGHLTIGKNVQIAAKAGVMQDLPDNSIVGGLPAINIRDWHRQSIALKKLIKKE